MDFKEELNKKIDTINIELNNTLAIKYPIPTNIIDSMRYSVNSGGKRLRPLIAISIMDKIHGDYKGILPFAISLELIHTYSLIHDDLPAMDNDDLRRGKPTNHIVYGEDKAILAGDGLLNFAFENMLNNTENINQIKVCQEIANASGIFGMIGGQSLDIDLDKKIGSKEELLKVHENKTGKLFRSSFTISPILLDDTKLTKELNKISYDYGIAFQILDDILDKTSSTVSLGKPVGSDDINNKTTYITLYGLDKSKQMYLTLKEKILEDTFNIFSDSFIFNLIKYTLDRIN